MKKIKLGIIGAGNIIETRHLPALQRNKKLFEVVGILSIHESHAKKLASKYQISHFSSYKKYSDLQNIDWLQDVDAVLIGVPPLEHAPMIEKCLQMNKHVLVEKPFVTDLKKGQELVKLATKKKLVLSVVHNFQFSSSFLKLEKTLKTKELGVIKSFYCTQLTNNSRRLPTWADELPLGLFYDETPHVFYLLKKFGGDLILKNVYKTTSQNKKNTPQLLNIDLTANKIPASIYINFESPISEWLFIIVGTKKIGIVDMFRDILTVLPHDEQHLMKEVLRTSSLATLQHWKGFIENGFKYIQHKLYYGMDVVHENFYNAVTNRKVPFNMSGEDGLLVNKIQWEVVDKSSK